MSTVTSWSSVSWSRVQLCAEKEAILDAAKVHLTEIQPSDSKRMIQGGFIASSELAGGNLLQPGLPACGVYVGQAMACNTGARKAKAG